MGYNKCDEWRYEHSNKVGENIIVLVVLVKIHLTYKHIYITLMVFKHTYSLVLFIFVLGI